MAAQGTKIIDLIAHSEKFSFSFEVTSDVSEANIDKEVEPAFYSVTWHAKSHKCMSLDIDPLKTANILKNKDKEVLLHLSCDMLRKDYLDELLVKLRESGICNLFVILGEGYDSSTSDFLTTIDLIKYIREKTGDYFCIGIAGFPDCTDEKLLQMKEKIDVGANFIVTQAFFEPTVFKNFFNRCQEVGINVPIIPGVFLFENYKQLNSFISLCKVKVSSNILEKIKNDEPSSLESLDIIKNLLKVLRDEFNVNHFHFFTLNKLSSVSSFIKHLI